MKIINFELFENTAKSTQGNQEGMGNVRSPQPIAEKPGKVNKLPSEKEEKRIPEPKEEETTQNESVKTFEQFHLNEDGGVAAATLGNTAGMGDVASPGVGNIDASGKVGAMNVYSGDGSPTPTGTKGSGDVVAKAAKNPKASKATKANKKARLKGTTTGKDIMYVTKFEDWQKPDGTNESSVNEAAKEFRDGEIEVIWIQAKSKTKDEFKKWWKENY